MPYIDWENLVHGHSPIRAHVLVLLQLWCRDVEVLFVVVAVVVVVVVVVAVLVLVVVVVVVIVQAVVLLMSFVEAVGGVLVASHISIQSYNRGPGESSL